MSRASLEINKRKSSTATLRRYITKPPRAAVCIFLPPTTHTHHQHVWTRKRWKGEIGRVVMTWLLPDLLLGTRKGRS